MLICCRKTAYRLPEQEVGAPQLGEEVKNLAEQAKALWYLSIQDMQKNGWGFLTSTKPMQRLKMCMHLECRLSASLYFDVLKYCQKSHPEQLV